MQYTVSRPSEHATYRFFRLVFAGKPHLIHPVPNPPTQAFDLGKQSVQGFGGRLDVQNKTAAVFAQAAVQTKQ